MTYCILTKKENLLFHTEMAEIKKYLFLLCHYLFPAQLSGENQKVYFLLTFLPIPSILFALSAPLVLNRPFVLYVASM